MPRKIYIITVMLCCIYSAAVSQDILKVYYRPHGYSGNLYFREFSVNPSPDALKWFYVENDKLHSVVLKRELNGRFELYSGYNSLSFDYVSGKPKLISPTQAAVIQNIRGRFQISFNTKRIKIISGGNDQGYNFSAYNHLPGTDSTDDTHRIIFGNRTIKLIIGMSYSIAAPGSDFLPKAVVNKPMPGNPGFYACDTIRQSPRGVQIKAPGSGDYYLNDFVFTPDSTGAIGISNKASAFATNNSLSFNIAKAYIDPAKISHGNKIFYLYDAATIRSFDKPQYLKVIKGLLNHIWWLEEGITHDYYYVCP